MKKYKVLAWCDTPVIETGFAQVSKQIFKALHATGKFDIEIAGINHYVPTYNREQYPYAIHKIISRNEDPVGKEVFKELVINGTYDILFTFNDISSVNELATYIKQVQIQREKEGRPFRWIDYSPVDREMNKFDQLDCFDFADYAVTYTKYGVEEINKAAIDNELEAVLNKQTEKTGIVREYSKIPAKLKYIYHGCDMEDIVPATRAERKTGREKIMQLKRNDKDTFVITNINRNQWRKDFPRTIMAFNEFNKIVPNAKLYLHARRKDMGGDLRMQVFALGGNPNICLADDTVMDIGGYSRDQMKYLYGMSDVLISTTLGEGWGLSTTEAFAAKLPVIMPRNTSMMEIVGEKEERGLLADSGSNVNLWTISVGYSNAKRPMTDIDSMVQKLLDVYENRGAAEDRAEAAYEWATQHPWEKINEQWVELFTEAAKSL